MGILLACMLSIGLNSCGSDDGGLIPEPSEPIDITDIVGGWRCASGTPSEMVGQIFTINENYTFTCTSPLFGTSGTFTLTGNTMMLQSAGVSFTIHVSLMGGQMRWNGSSSDGIAIQYTLARVANDEE